MAASFVRQGAVFADIGTDHAYLPLFLLTEQRISSCIASDVREGPLAIAKRNAEEAGLAHRIVFRLTSGLQGMEDLGITDVAMCGMGGELIASLIDEASFLRDEKIRLILQPMSRGAFLRSYLASKGFAVTDEAVCLSSGKYYACFAAHYTGVPHSLTEAEAEVGRLLLLRAPNAVERRFIEGVLLSARRRLAGIHREKRRDTTEAIEGTQQLILDLEAYLNSYTTL